MKSQKIILDRGCRQVPSTTSAVIAAIAFSFLTPLSSSAQSATELLRQADHFADLGDWHNAGPLYARVEQAFRSIGDAPNELYAKFGRLHLKSRKGRTEPFGRRPPPDYSPPRLKPNFRCKSAAWHFWAI